MIICKEDRIYAIFDYNIQQRRFVTGPWSWSPYQGLTWWVSAQLAAHADSTELADTVNLVRPTGILIRESKEQLYHQNYHSYISGY